MTTPKYLCEADYSKLVATALTNAASFDVPSCPFTGRPTKNEIKIMLGEDWDIWPASILLDAP